MTPLLRLAAEKNKRLTDLLRRAIPYVKEAKELGDFESFCPACMHFWSGDASDCLPDCDRAAWLREASEATRGPTPPRYDDVYFEGVRAMNEAENGGAPVGPLPVPTDPTLVSA